MTLQNLLAIGQLREHETSSEEIQTLLIAVRRNLADAQILEISLETRFDAAYKAIMQLSMIALLANGFRPGSGAGHHMTMIQSLPKSVGLNRERIVILDALRRKRNAADYMGSYVDQAATDTCISEAQTLLRDVESWLSEHRSDLL